MQIRSEALDTIERALSKMNFQLQNAKGLGSTDPELQWRQRRIKGTLNRIEFEVLLDRSDNENAEDLGAETQPARLATVLQFAR